MPEIFEGLYMSTFLEEAKKEYWRAGREVSRPFISRVERLLLEKLSVLGEITDEDRLWAKQLAEDTLA